MVHGRVSVRYIKFAIMYTPDNTFTALPIKQLVNKDGETTKPHKLEAGIKTSVSNLRFLLCPCVVRKSTAHFDTKALNICHH